MNKTIITFTFLTIFSLSALYAQVKVGENPTSIDGSAALEVESNSRGFLPPRMTAAQRDAMLAPATGLVIFNVTSNCINFYTGSDWNEVCGTLAPPSYPEGSVFCSAGSSEVIQVVNPNTSKIWMDRNLGASRVAQSSSDALAYGDLFQWGRRSDGHQCRNSSTTSTLSTSDQPNHGDFIVRTSSSFSSPWDWRSPQNNNLWQGVNGSNNPCPFGYRLPTEAEWNNERLSWNTNDANGAFSSPLKLPQSGYRAFDGPLRNPGSTGDYWSSSISGQFSRGIIITSSGALIDSYARSMGYAVRCIKN